ncbi:MAG: polyphosphate kinase 2 family protein [Acidobacteriota bacterium]|nr:polyphosphate kinase 2 family protein [Acidobacteriota bacterium]MDH3523799.1 polyphosphate kinase 2 family protein [Acidobacteriota bacterium]
MSHEIYRVGPGSEVDLTRHDPRDLALCAAGKREGRRLTGELNAELEALQELLWAEGWHKLLVVLQAMDTGGKDGTIRHVFDGTNPQGVKVASFKRPTAEELAHDYLWRVHRHAPGSGEIVIFNRSHYEDVLVVRVHELVPAATWSRRYDHINDFERRLADEGTTILKFFLHISKEEQRERLQARLAEPDKRWKFARGDLAERARWDDYRAAYEAVLSRTSTPWAPWYVVPADRKWYRNLVVSRVLVDTLKELDMRFPEAEVGLDDVVIE